MRASAGEAESLWESVEEVLARPPSAAEASEDEDLEQQLASEEGGQQSEDSKVKAGLFAAIGRLVICQVRRPAVLPAAVVESINSLININNNIENISISVSY